MFNKWNLLREELVNVCVCVCMRERVKEEEPKVGEWATVFWFKMCVWVCVCVCVCVYVCVCQRERECRKKRFWSSNLFHAFFLHWLVPHGICSALLRWKEARNILLDFVDKKDRNTCSIVERKKEKSEGKKEERKQKVKERKNKQVLSFIKKCTVILR